MKPRPRGTAAPVPLVPVRRPEDSGWLTAVEASALLKEMFGATVTPRTVQRWTRDPDRPLRHVRLGHHLLVYRADLLTRVGLVPP